MMISTVLWQVSEIGTLSQVFQWRGDNIARTLPNFSQTERGSVSDTLSEVSFSAMHVQVEGMCNAQSKHSLSQAGCMTNQL